MTVSRSVATEARAFAASPRACLACRVFSSTSAISFLRIWILDWSRSFPCCHSFFSFEMIDCVSTQRANVPRADSMPCGALASPADAFGAGEVFEGVEADGAGVEGAVAGAEDADGPDADGGVEGAGAGEAEGDGARGADVESGVDGEGGGEGGGAGWAAIVKAPTVR